MTILRGLVSGAWGCHLILTVLLHEASASPRNPPLRSDRTDGGRSSAAKYGITDSGSVNSTLSAGTNYPTAIPDTSPNSHIDYGSSDTDTHPSLEISPLRTNITNQLTSQSNASRLPQTASDTAIPAVMRAGHELQTTSSPHSSSSTSLVPKESSTPRQHEDMPALAKGDTHSNHNRSQGAAGSVQDTVVHNQTRVQPSVHNTGNKTRYNQINIVTNVPSIGNMTRINQTDAQMNDLDIGTRTNHSQQNVPRNGNSTTSTQAPVQPDIPGMGNITRYNLAPVEPTVPTTDSTTRFSLSNDLSLRNRAEHNKPEVHSNNLITGNVTEYNHTESQHTGKGIGYNQINIHPNENKSETEHTYPPPPQDVVRNISVESFTNVNRSDAILYSILNSTNTFSSVNANLAPEINDSYIRYPPIMSNNTEPPRPNSQNNSDMDIDRGYFETNQSAVLHSVASMNDSSQQHHSQDGQSDTFTNFQQPAAGSAMPFGFVWSEPNWDYTKYVDIRVTVLSCFLEDGTRIEGRACRAQWDFSTNARRQGILVYGRNSSENGVEFFLLDVWNLDDDIDMFHVKLNSSQLEPYLPWLVDPPGYVAPPQLNPKFQRVSYDMVPAAYGFDIYQWQASPDPAWYRGHRIRLWIALDGCQTAGQYISPGACRTILNLTKGQPPYSDFINYKYSVLPNDLNDSAASFERALVNIFVLDYQTVFSIQLNSSTLALYRPWLNMNPSDRGPPTGSGNFYTNNDLENSLNSFDVDLQPNKNGDSSVSYGSIAAPESVAHDKRMNVHIAEQEKHQDLNGVHWNDSDVVPRRPDLVLFEPEMHLATNDTAGIPSPSSVPQLTENLNDTNSSSISANGSEASYQQINLSTSLNASHTNGTGEGRDDLPILTPVPMRSNHQGDVIDHRSPPRPGHWESLSEKFTQAHLRMLRKNGYPAHAIHGLIWEDREYMISVLIPVILGVIGALVIVCIAYGARSCQSSKSHVKQMHAIQNSIDIEQASRLTKTEQLPYLDRVMLLADSSDEEGPP